jgi:hypothetical protein
MGKRNRLNKRQSQATDRLKSRQPESSESTDHKKPTFNLEHLRKSHCISSCSEEVKTAFVDKLYELTQQNWLQLKLASRKGMGYEKISSHSMKQAIPSHISEDTNIISFKFYGKAPMV